MPSAVEALQRQWAADDAARARRRKARQKKPGRSFLSGLKDFASDVVPDLGIGNTAKMLTSIPAGIGYIGSTLAPGGVPLREGTAQMGKGFLHSFQNTGATIAKPLGGDFWYEPGVEALNKVFLKEDIPKPQDILERARDSKQGLIPAIIEDVGNVAIVGAPAARALKLGPVGRLAAPEALQDVARLGGASTRLARQSARWSARAAKTAEKLGPEGVKALQESGQIASRAKAIRIAEAMAHPYETTFRATVGRSGSAAQAAQRVFAAQEGARLAEEAGEGQARFIVSPSGEVQATTDLAEEARIAEREARAGIHPGPARREPAPQEPVDLPPGQIDRQLVGGARPVLDEAGEPIEPIAARVGPAEEAAISRKGTPPVPHLLERHLARLYGGGFGATVTRKLADTQGWLDSRVLRWVNREGERFVEAARRQERNEPWYQQAVTAARDHLVNQIDPATGERISAAMADELVGSEVISRLVGLDMLNRAGREVVGEAWSQPMIDAFQQKIGARKAVIPEALMTPELEQALDSIAQEYRTRSKVRVGTLIGDRLGTRGLESLNENAPVMNRSQRREYVRLKRASQHQATTQQRKMARARRKVYRQIAALQRQIDEGGADIEKLNAEADALDEVAQGLLTYTKPRLRDGAREAFWNEIVERTLREGGATADPAAAVGRTFDMSGGWATAMLPGTVRRVRLADFAPSVLEEVYQSNRNFLTDPDAKVGTWVHGLDETNITQVDIDNGLQVGDQVVDIDFSQDTLAGAPLTRWQAKILGTARNQESVYGPGDQVVDLPFSDEAQALASVFRPLIRNPDSQMNRTLRSLYEVPEKLARQKGIDPADVRLLEEDIDKMVDVAMAEAVYAAKGTDDLDKFWGEWRAAVNYDPQRVLANKPGSLFQVIMKEPSVRAAFEKAKATFPAQEHLASWYYRSHDFVEETFRPMGDVTLLDGTRINMADLMYQLIAVTSIQSTPLTNLGNALSSVRNLQMALSRTDDDMLRLVEKTQEWRRMPWAADDVRDLFDMLYPPRTNTGARTYTPGAGRATVDTPEVRAIGYRPLEVDEAIETRTRQLVERGETAEKAREIANKEMAGYGTGIYPTGEQVKAVYMILSGHTLDKWDSNMASTVNELFGGERKGALSAANIPPSTVELARRQLEALRSADGTVNWQDALRQMDDELVEFYRVRHEAGEKGGPPPGVEGLHYTTSTYKGKTYYHDITPASATFMYPVEVWMALPDGPMGNSGRVYHTLNGEVQRRFPEVTEMWDENGPTDEFLPNIDGLIADVEALAESLRGKGPESYDGTTIDYVWRSYADHLQGLKRLVLQYRSGVPVSEASVIDRALMLHHGSKAWAKLRSFYENLSQPDVTQAVTLDEWMARLFGMRDWVTGGQYAAVTRKIANYADSLGMKPHEVQALLWAYAKHRITRGEVGRLAAGAWDGFDLLRKDGNFRFGTEADPLYRLLQEDLDLSVLDKDIKAQIADAQKAARLAGQQAEDYVAQVGRGLGVRRKPRKVSPVADFDEGVMRQAGREYLDAPDASADPEMIAAYEALKAETRAQYQYLTEVLGVDVRFVAPNEEYGVALDDVAQAHREMAADLVANKRLKVRSTATAGDEPTPFMSEIDPETGLMFNDMFRAVHDAFGHAHANDFSRQGEQVAFRAHAQMFSPEALPAMASETLGQNSALILTGEFPPQKVARLSDATINDALQETVSRKPHAITRKTRIAEPTVRADGTVDYGAPLVSKPKIRTENQEWVVGSDKKAMARSRNTYDAYRAAAARANKALDEGLTPDAAQEEILKFVRDTTRSARHESATGFDEALNPRVERALLDVEMGLDHEALVRRLEANGQDGDTLFQSLGSEIRGALVRESNKTVDYTLRVFPNADFATLMHENAHLLRKFLTPEDQRKIEAWLGVKFAQHSAAAWRDAEETFADAFINYLLTGSAPNRAVTPAFDRTKEILTEAWDAWRDSRAATMELPDEMYAWFDNVLSPDVQAIPEEFNQFLPATGPSKIRNIIETPVHPDETPTAAKMRTYRATRAADDARLKRALVVERQNRVARLQKKKMSMETLLKEQGTAVEIEYARRQKAINKAVQKLGRQLQDPATGQVPAKWQPLWDAYKRIVREAQDNPALELPDEWIDQFSAMLRVAIDNGFDPTHVRSFTPKQVEGLMYGQMRLGADFRAVGSELAAGTRAARTRPHAVAQSVSALAAAMVEVVHESQTNHLVDFIEGNLASRVVGGYIPKGWVAWDPVRRFIVTGEKIEEGGRVVQTVGKQPTMMVPEAVAKTIRNMGRDYTHWAFKALAKVQDPWRALVLTMTPRWYVNNFLGNLVLTTTQGVSLRDWLMAWHEYRQREFSGQDMAGVPTGELGRAAMRDIARLRKGRKAQPFSDIPGVTGASIYSDLTDPRNLMVPGGVRAKARYIAGTKDRNRVVTAYQVAVSKLSRANEVVDEMARAATYFSATRKGLTPEAALMRAYETLIDYGNLSPIERQMVRAVIPFYAWQKGILKLVVKAGVEHPAAAAVTLQLDRLADEWLQDQFGTELPQGYAGLIPFGDTAVQTRGLNPFADSGALVTAQGIARSMNPIAESLVRSELGAPEGGIVKEQRVNEFGRLVPEVSLSEEASTSLFGGLPQVQLGQRITGTSPSPYGEPFARSVGRYLGVPLMSGEEVSRLVERTRESRATLAGPREKKSKPKDPFAEILARLRRSSQVS